MAKTDFCRTSFSRFFLCVPDISGIVDCSSEPENINLKLDIPRKVGTSLYGKELYIHKFLNMNYIYTFQARQVVAIYLPCRTLHWSLYGSGFGKLDKFHPFHKLSPGKALQSRVGRI